MATYPTANSPATSTSVLDTSLSTLAPAAIAARATASFCVSTETGPNRLNASMTGTTRAISSSSATGVAPGRVDSPPTSTMSQPDSKYARPRATASAVASVRESGKNESGVTLTMPMTLGLSAMQTDVGG